MKKVAKKFNMFIAAGVVGMGFMTSSFAENTYCPETLYSASSGKPSPLFSVYHYNAKGEGKIICKYNEPGGGTPILTSYASYDMVKEQDARWLSTNASEETMCLPFSKVGKKEIVDEKRCPFKAREMPYRFGAADD